MPVDYQQPRWQTPEGNEGTVLAGIIARSRQQQTEKDRLGMEQQQWQMQQSEMKRQAKAATDKSIAFGKLQKYLAPSAEGGGGLTFEQVARIDPATILAAGQPLPQRQKMMEARPNSGIYDPDTGQFHMTPPAAAAPKPIPARDQAYKAYIDMIAKGVLPKDAAIKSGYDMSLLKPQKEQEKFSDETETLPSGETLFGQRGNLSNKFTPFSSYGQEGGSVLERAARAAAAKKEGFEKSQAAKNKVRLEAEKENPQSWMPRIQKLKQLHPEWPATKLKDQVQDDIDAEIEKQDEIMAGGVDEAKPESKEAEHFKAGTKVKNAKGEIKFLKTNGSLPEGWTPAQ